MAHQALRARSRRQAVGAEAGSVGADSPTNGRMTRQAATLRVACGATLEPLTRRPAVLEQPLRLCRMKSRVQATFRLETRLLVTAAAEQLRVMARGAFVFPAVGIGGVSLGKGGGVESPRRLAGMTIRAEAPFMTARAGQSRR